MTARVEPCNTSLITDPIGEVATEVIGGEVVLYVYAEGFRIRIDRDKFATLRAVCHAVDSLYASQGLAVPEECAPGHHSLDYVAGAGYWTSCTTCGKRWATTAEPS